MSDQDEKMQALLDMCNVIVNKMKEEGTYGEPHRVREYVDSLIDHTIERFPNLMQDDERSRALRDEVTTIILMHYAMKRDN